MSKVPSAWEPRYAAFLPARPSVRLARAAISVLDPEPAEREAVFETLDEEVAADALEEVEPKLQRSIVESLDEDRAADIVDEMDPDAAADLLGDLTEEKSDAILEEMQPEQREDVEELLEQGEDFDRVRFTRLRAPSGK